MEIVSLDGVRRVVDVNFVSKSHILSDMETGPVTVQVSDKILTHLINGTWPTKDYELLECAHAADFLHMEDVLEEACRLVAERLRGKSAKEIKKFIGYD
jgi:hypothetical protein